MARPGIFLLAVAAIAIAASGLLGAGCGARAASSSAPSATPASEAAPAGAEPPQEPHAAIEQLDGEIAAWRTQLGLEPPPPDAIAAAQGRPLPMAAEGCHPAAGTPSPAGAVCSDVCRLADAICGNADRICRLADGLPADTWAADRCAGAKASCSAARDRCCGCR